MAPWISRAQVAEVEPLPQPNIILILIDDLGFGDLGCYGARLQQTPNLDRLAAEGAKFTDFYMSAPVCSPSRAALVTGSYHKRVSVNHVLWPVSPNGLSPTEVTIAEVLRDHGYATRYYGKWHLGDQKEFLPTRQGFEHFHGIPYSHDMGSLVKLKKLKGQLNPLHTRVVPVMRDEKVEELVHDVGPLLHDYEAELVDFMGVCVAQKKPFFAMLAQHAVHLPNEPSKSFLGSSQNGPYGDWIQEIDDSIGRIMNEITSLGIEKDTMVLFTSDNGPSRRNNGSAGPLRGSKHTTWEGGVRVPFLAHWPGTIPPGQVRRELVTCMDIMPTVSALAGVPYSPETRPIDGVNISQLLIGGTPLTPPRRTFAYYSGPNLMAVRQDTWKLHLRAPDGKSNVLYDLATDRAESTNVAADHPEIVAQLQQLADQFRADLGDGPKHGKGIRKVGRVATLRPLFDAVSHPHAESDDYAPDFP